MDTMNMKTVLPSPSGLVSHKTDRKRDAILAEIIGATGLNPNKNNDINPFVLATLIDNDSAKMELLRKTKSIKKSRNPIFCVEHRCLFLVHLTPEMRQRLPSFEIEFDVRDKNANNPSSCSPLGCYRFAMSDVIDVCDNSPEERLERTLKLSDITGKDEMATKNKQEDKGSIPEPMIAVRFRFASKHDLKIMRDLEIMHEGGGLNFPSLSMSDPGHKLSQQQRKKMKKERRDPTIAKLVTEINEKEFGYDNMMKVISGSYFRMKTTGKNGVKRLRVLPRPDPKRVKGTKFLSHEELIQEMFKPSTNWMEVGCEKDSLGTVYLEILQCQGLPNMDAGGALGNKTDTFVSAIFEESMVQTDVIDDKLSPMWMPWCQRAFLFHIKHPLSQLFIGVNDFDLGPSAHDGIGRVAINLNHFESDMAYTLSYNITPASNVPVREENLGTITIRLRKEIKDEKVHLLSSLKPMPRFHVNMQYVKSLPVANFTCYGKHNEDLYDIQLLKNYVNEILEFKRFLFYAIGDAAKSLVMWKGQVKICGMDIPLHSACAFFSATYIIERPHLLPGFFFISIAWIMLASMLNRIQHPSPWHKVPTFFHYLHILVKGEAPEKRTAIASMENHKEAKEFEANWQHRIETDLNAAWKAWELQLEMDRIGNEDLNTEETKTLTDPLAIALENLKPKLFPIQKRLRGYCKILRRIKVVTSWEESMLAFWVTFPCLVFGVSLMILPTVWLCHWICRIMIWTCLGPWIRIYCEFFVFEHDDPMLLRSDEDRDRHQDKMFDTIARTFEEKGKIARLKGEEAVKMKAMRMFNFGRFAAKVPRLHVDRHYDYPIANSKAVYTSLRSNPVKSTIKLPSQHLEGHMIPLSDTQLLKTIEKGKAAIKAPSEMSKHIKPLSLSKTESLPHVDKHEIQQNQSSFITNSVDDIEELQTFLTCDSEDEDADDYVEYTSTQEERRSDVSVKVKVTCTNSEKRISSPRIDEITPSFYEESNDVEEEGVEVIACGDGHSPEDSKIPVADPNSSPKDGKSSSTLSPVYKSSNSVYMTFCR